MALEDYSHGDHRAVANYFYKRKTNVKLLGGQQSRTFALLNQ